MRRCVFLCPILRGTQSSRFQASAWAVLRAKVSSRQASHLFLWRGTARECLSLDACLDAHSVTETGHGLPDRRDRISFALNFFCSLMLFSPHVWSTLKFVVYSKAVVEYSHSGATCSATSNRHDRALLLNKWQAAKSAAERQRSVPSSTSYDRGHHRCAETHEPGISGNGEGGCREFGECIHEAEGSAPTGQEFPQDLIHSCLNERGAL